MKAFALSLPLLAAACSEAPPAAADPERVEQALAAAGAEAAAAEPPAADKARDKLEKADRLVGTLDKVQPDRVDPDVAASLLDR